MRLWPWRCHHNSDELDSAHEQADKAITDAQQLHTRADQVASDLSKVREANHFAVRIAGIIRGN